MTNQLPVVMLDPNGGTPGQVPRINDDGTAVEYADAATGGTGPSGVGAIPYATKTRTTGNYTISSTTWADVDNTMDLTVTAEAGDVLFVMASGLWNDEASEGHLNAGTVVGGAVLNLVEPTATKGIASWWGRSAVILNLGTPFRYIVQAGDVVTGQVTLRLRGRKVGTANKTLFGGSSSQFFFQWSVLNISRVGQAAAELTAGLTAHLADTSDAHDASAISYAGSTNLSATDVEAALDELDAEKPSRETTSRIVYVATTGSDSTGNGSSGSPWRTIQHAVNQAKNILYPNNGTSAYTILAAAGTYVESVVIPPNVFGSFAEHGDGGMRIQSQSGVAADVILRASGAVAVDIFGSTSLQYLTIESDDIGVLARGGAHIQVVIDNCLIRRTSASNGGNAAIYTQLANIYSRNNTGTTGRLFGYGLRAYSGGVISKASSTQPAGSTANENVANGGVIR